MGAPPELARAIERHVGKREARKLGAAIDALGSQLGDGEQVLEAACGRSLQRSRSLLIATSRQVLSSDGARTQALPYTRISGVETRDGLRKSTITIRGQGAVIDLQDVQMDRAREIVQTVRQALRGSGVWAVPGA